jgi:hypothetical protein
MLEMVGAIQLDQSLSDDFWKREDSLRHEQICWCSEVFGKSMAIRSPPILVFLTDVHNGSRNMDSVHAKAVCFQETQLHFLLQQVVIPEIGLFWAVSSSFLDNLHSTTLFEHKTAVSGADLEEVLERFVIRDLLVLGGERGGGRNNGADG